MELNKTVLKNLSTLKAYYRFEETSGTSVSDSSGSSNTGTASRTNILNNSGGVFGNKALFASASSDKISFTDSSDFKPTGNFSISMWFNATSNDGVLFQSYSANPNVSGILVYYNSGSVINFRTGKNTGSTQGVDWQQTASSSVATGSWHHLVCVWDGSFLRVFIDGKHDTSIAWANAPAYAASNYVRIGTYNTSGTDTALFYNGSIDDFAFYNGTALSADQVKELYEGRYVGELWPQSNLQGLWHMSNETDFSGNLRNLTNTGSLSFTRGKYNLCADTGASNSTKKLTVASNCGIAGGNCSINLWFNSYATTFAGDHPPLVSCFSDQTGGAGVAYGLGINTTGLFAFRLKSGIAWQETSATTISASTWYMATMTYDGTNCKLYINGSYVSQVAASGNGSTGVYPDQTAFFSHAGYTADVYTSAKIDEAVIWNKTLTDNEIRKLYAWQVGKYQ